MFAGIVEGKSRVVQIGPGKPGTPDSAARRLVLDMGRLAEGLTLGASVSVNGVCLTVCQIKDAHLAFDVVSETLRRTNLDRLRPDSCVNVERSLRFGQPIDGHLVQGHIEGMAEVARVEDAERGYLLWFLPPADLLKYVISKGAVALDGVSLTVADVRPPYVAVALIPTTLRETTLGERGEGDLLNMETDFMVRAVVQRLDQVLPEIERGVAEARA